RVPRVRARALAGDRERARRRVVVAGGDRRDHRAGLVVGERVLPALRVVAVDQQALALLLLLGRAPARDLHELAAEGPRAGAPAVGLLRVAGTHAHFGVVGEFSYE